VVPRCTVLPEVSLEVEFSLPRSRS